MYHPTPRRLYANIVFINKKVPDRVEYAEEVSVIETIDGSYIIESLGDSFYLTHKDRKYTNRNIKSLRIKKQFTKISYLHRRSTPFYEIRDIRFDYAGFVAKETIDQYSNYPYKMVQLYIDSDTHELLKVKDVDPDYETQKEIQANNNVASNKKRLQRKRFLQKKRRNRK